MTGPHVGPEDEGTGVASGSEDDVDAANVASYVDTPNARDFVVDGLDLQNVDFTNLTFDLSAGKARLHQASATTESGGTQSSETRDHVTFTGEWTSRTGLSLTDNAVNRVWLWLDLTTADSPEVRVDTEASPNVPPQPNLQIHEIDTNTNSLTTGLADNPDGTFDTLSSTSLDTGQRNTVKFASVGDNIQTLVDEVKTAGGGTVFVESGTHDVTGYAPIELGNGNVYLKGAGMGSENPTNAQHSTLLDAAGGTAVQVSGGGGGSAFAFGITDLSVNGRVLINPSGQCRDFVVSDIDVFGADSGQHTGRGFEIPEGLTVFQHDLRNINADSCDGAGIYLGSLGQTRVAGCNAGLCGDVVDGYQMYFGDGNLPVIVNPYVADSVGSSGSKTVTGIKVGSFSPTLIGPVVERNQTGILLDGNSGDTNGAKIYGGAAVSNDGSGVKFGGTNTAKGCVLTGGIQLNGNGTAVEFTSNAQYNHLGNVVGPFGQKALNDVSVTYNGFENYLNPYWHTRNGGPQDVTTLSVPAFAIELDDGTNTSSGNIGIAAHWKGTWYYMS